MLEELRRLFPRAAHARMGVQFLAHHVMVKLALSNSPTKSEVEDLLNGHYERQSLGAHDFVAEAAIATLRHLGRLEEARIVREDYLTRHRKERRKVSPLFRHLAS